MQIHSQQIERHVLSGLFRFPEIFPDVDNFLNEKDFFVRIHSVIYSVVRESLLQGEDKLDKILIANKIKNLGIAFKDDVDIFDYVEDLSLTQVTKEAAIEASKNLAKYRMCREIYETFASGQKFIENNLNEGVDKIISGCDQIYGDRISSYSLTDEPQNIFEDMEEIVEELGNNPTEESGFSTSFPEFDRLFGGLLPGNIYAIISRPGQGKSTWINEMCLRTAADNNVPPLLLDTEMGTREVQFRMVSALSGVSLWYIQTGNWRKNAEMCKKVRAAWKKIESEDWRYYYYPVGNKSIDEVCSLIRRWYYSKIGRGNPCIIAYDYIKLTTERVGANWGEHQAIGEKIDKLKKISEEIGAPIVTAMQQNRSGEAFNRRVSQIQDDSSTAALSDRLQWFASFVGIFRTKVAEEIQMDGPENGSHKLIPIKTRFQGRDAQGFQNLMRRTFVETVAGREVRSTMFTPNFINYDITNFKVEERGSLRHIIERENELHDITTEGNGALDDLL
jgi:replicative DNA helicase